MRRQRSTAALARERGDVCFSGVALANFKPPTPPGNGQRFNPTRRGLDFRCRFQLPRFRGAVRTPRPEQFVQSRLCGTPDSADDGSIQRCACRDTTSMEAGMVPGPRLRAYLALERAMVDLADAGDAVADELRDRMDPIWRCLTEEEHRALDNRSGDASVFAGELQLLVPMPPRRDISVRESVRQQFRCKAACSALFQPATSASMWFWGAGALWNGCPARNPRRFCSVADPEPERRFWRWMWRWHWREHQPEMCL